MPCGSLSDWRMAQRRVVYRKQARQAIARISDQNGRQGLSYRFLQDHHLRRIAELAQCLDPVSQFGRQRLNWIGLSYISGIVNWGERHHLAADARVVMLGAVLVDHDHVFRVQPIGRVQVGEGGGTVVRMVMKQHDLALFDQLLEFFLQGNGVFIAIAHE